MRKLVAAIALSVMFSGVILGAYGWAQGWGVNGWALAVAVLTIGASLMPSLSPS